MLGEGTIVGNVRPKDWHRAPSDTSRRTPRSRVACADCAARGPPRAMSEITHNLTFDATGSSSSRQRRTLRRSTRGFLRTALLLYRRENAINHLRTATYARRTRNCSASSAPEAATFRGNPPEHARLVSSRDVSVSFGVEHRAAIGPRRENTDKIPLIRNPLEN